MHASAVLIFWQYCSVTSENDRHAINKSKQTLSRQLSKVEPFQIIPCKLRSSEGLKGFSLPFSLDEKICFSASVEDVDTLITF
jgi:hypothetical protein